MLTSSVSLIQPPVQLADGDLECLLLYMYRDILHTNHRSLLLAHDN